MAPVKKADVERALVEEVSGQGRDLGFVYRKDVKALVSDRDPFTDHLAFALATYHDFVSVQAIAGIGVPDVNATYNSLGGNVSSRGNLWCKRIGMHEVESLDQIATLAERIWQDYANGFLSQAKGWPDIPSLETAVFDGFRTVEEGKTYFSFSGFDSAGKVMILSHEAGRQDHCREVYRWSIERFKEDKQMVIKLGKTLGVAD